MPRQSLDIVVPKLIDVQCQCTWPLAQIATATTNVAAIENQGILIDRAATAIKSPKCLPFAARGARNRKTRHVHAIVPDLLKLCVS